MIASLPSIALEEDRMSRAVVAVCAFSMAYLAGPAMAFDDTPAPNLNLSCARFKEFSRGGDASLMQQLSGVWQAEFAVPPVQGVFEATTQQVQTTRYAQGSLLYEEYQCFKPVGVAGLPPLAGSCATAVGHGYWYARPDNDGWFAVGVWQEGSDFAGYRVGPNCGLTHARFLDESTVQNEYGQVGRRVGAAQ